MFAFSRLAKGRVSTSRRVRRDAAGFESLEQRQVMTSISISAGVLRVQGSAGNDLIEIVRTNAVVTATISSADTGRLLQSCKYNIQRTPFATIRVDALGGNDVVKNKTAINSYIDGGSGADRLFGGRGTDTLVGNTGQDVLVSIGGGHADVLWGGAGDDSFWLDAEATERIGDLAAPEIAGGHAHRVRAFQTNGYDLDNDYAYSLAQSQAIGRELDGGNLLDPPQRSADEGDVSLVSFIGYPLFSTAGPSSNDIKQGNLGDCYFLSALGAIADRCPDRIRQLVADLGDGTYAVHFRDANGSDAFVRVDADLWVNERNAPAYAGLGEGNSLWVAIVEKAWAFHRHSQSTASRSSGTYDSASNAAGYYDRQGEVPLDRALGVLSRTTANDGSHPGERQFLDAIASELAAGKAVTLGAASSLGTDRFVQDDATRRRSQHIFMVVSVAADRSQVVLRNPHNGARTISVPASDVFFSAGGFRVWTVA